MTGHVTEEVLQLFVDGELDAATAQEIRRHLDQCNACARTYAAMRSFDHFIRNLPLEAPHRDIAHDTLIRLGIAPRAPRYFRVLEYVASAVAMAIVIATGGSVWALLTWGETDGSTTQSVPAPQALEFAKHMITTVSMDLAQFVSRVSEVGVGGQAGNVIAMVVCIVPLIALVDWLLRRRGVI